MPGRGVHFALTDDDTTKLLSCDGDDAVFECIQEIEEEYGENQPRFFAETDKAWDAIHRCLTDGALAYDNGSPPLNLCILGGRQLYGGDWYIVAFVSSEQAAQVAEALGAISKADLRQRYFAIPAEDYDADLGEEDFEYTWSWFQPLTEFWRRAAAAGRAVVFTVDQ